ncbi:MAG: NYN domain-containing protein [Gemmatimonadota bacterium]|nr:NYN domain-containing protein [Gemmatimonadota bacterium]MDE2983611.1 NYN domain-containing protein [Gemmatimonadota bacterium]
MQNPYTKALHTGPGGPVSQEAPNAALLIDFDNVTMGMRSDLAKELKHLLESDIIKGKVTVQRAYADWRRYPQYIVPLSEASIDLIFAPAYGSSKKNATDIRMAIDGMELVFIRPEIGTYILLTGDSDFSSLVLKLKEYGKYVIGIGIQESSSDILVQNCDEYYSYTALTGLSKTSELETGLPDAWQCVEEAVSRMVSRGDVMRSDRLKQVIMELSPGFNERDLGFKKFSKFLVEAANKGLLQIERASNGQYLIAPPSRGGRAAGARARGPEPAPNGDDQRGRARRGPQGRRPPARREARGDAAPRATRDTKSRPPAPRDRGPALDLLKKALREVAGRNHGPARDSDVKRKMMAIDRSFSENAIGFGKFSKFLQFAAGEGVVSVDRARDGSFRVRLAEAAGPAASPEFDARALGLPTTASSIKRYLAHRYKGVGVKTAEKLVDQFAADVFRVLHDEPERIRKVLPRSRADSVLTSWAADYERKQAVLAKTAPAPDGPVPRPNRDGRGRPAGGTARHRGPAPDDRARAASADATASSGPAGPGTASPAVSDAPPSETEKPARSGLFGLFRQGRRSR